MISRASGRTGPERALPVRASNVDPCHSHVKLSPSSFNVPPWCIHTLRKARGFPFCIITRTSRPSRSAETVPVAAMSLTGINGSLNGSPPSLSGSRRLDRSPIDPILEASLSEDGVVAGEKGLLAQLCAEVACVRIGDHVTWIVACAEVSSDELVETEPLWPRHLEDAVHRGSHRDPADRTRDILSRHGLDQNRRQTHRVAIGCSVSDALDELEELRGVDDRVRDRRLLDQPLLGDLRTEVAALGKAFGSHDRQGDVMAYPCRSLGLEEIAGRRLEELQHCRVLERWGVRHVDGHRGSVEGFGQPLAGGRVHTRVW